MFEYAEVQIERPVHDVFGFMADFESGSQWRSELLGMRRLTGKPQAVGARYRQEVQWEGRSLACVFEVTGVEPDRCIEIAGVADGVSAEVSFSFEPVGAQATRLTVRANAETSGPLYVLEPFLQGLVERQIDEDLASLRRLLESDSESLRSARSRAS